jgi:hypothetical protein
MLYCTYNECVVYNMFYTILFIVNKTKSILLHNVRTHVHLSLGNNDGDGAINLVIVEYCMYVLKLTNISVCVKVSMSVYKNVSIYVE